MSARHLVNWLPLAVAVGCGNPLPDSFDAPHARGPVAPVAVGETTTVNVEAAAGRTVSIDRVECIGCSAREIGRSELGARFEVTSDAAGTARLRVNVRNGEDRALVVESTITFAAPARIDGFRRFDDAESGTSWPITRGTEQTFCFAIAGAAGELLLHDPTRMEIAATGPIDVASVDDILEVPQGLGTVSASRCVRMVARERGAAEVTVRYREVERRIALDVVDPADIASIDVIDASFQSAVPAILDVDTNVIGSESALAEVRADICRAHPKLFVRGMLGDGRSTLVALDATNVVVAPASVAHIDIVRATELTLSSSQPGEGTLTFALGNATKTLPLRLTCTR